MKKKLLTVLLSVFMIMGVFTTRVFAENIGDTFKVNNIKYKITSINPNTVIVDDNKSFVYSTTITIPEKITYSEKEYTVTSINEYAFEELDHIQTVSIPNTVTSIGNYAFNGCKNLQEITLQENLKDIGKYAFHLCKELESITIPSSVENIGNLAFASCSKLSTVICKATEPPTLGTNAFLNHPDNFKIQVPANYVDAYKSSWNTYEDIIEALPIKISDILPDFFPATVGSGLKNDKGNGASAYVASDKMFFEIYSSDSFDISISSTVSKTSNSWYDYTEGNNHIRFYTNKNGIYQVTVIECDKDSLEGIYKSNPGTKINPWNIGTEEHLTDVTAYIDNETLYIEGTDTMADYETETSMPWNSYKESITSVVISGEITNIGKNLMRGCTYLTSVTLPSSITSIGEGAFCHCENLSSVTIPDNVTSIGEVAFEYCYDLEEITIPSSVENIGDEAFDACDNLKTVICNATIPPTLGDDAFYSCHDTLTFKVPTGYAFAYINNSSWEDYKDKIEVTIADILPSNFPITASSGWLKEGDSNNNRAYIDKNNSKLIVGSANATLNTVLTKDNDDYKCTVSGPSFTFNMESNVLESITLTVTSSASGDYIPYEYKIEPTGSKPQGYTGTLVFKTNGQYTNAADVIVTVDGNSLELTRDYAVDQGSIIVTLLGKYIKNLAPKTYTIAIGVRDSVSGNLLYEPITSQFTITAVPTPSSDPTPRYKVPNTGVEGTTNNHSLLKLSSLSLLAIGTYMVIKKKKDN